jgi:TM2 domain-containing membrane protein YozV
MTDIAGPRTDLPNPGVAAVLSFVIPGLGQFYTGRFWCGIFWLIVAPGVWFVTATTFGWVCHVIAAYTAYSYAKSRHV